MSHPRLLVAALAVLLVLPAWAEDPERTSVAVMNFKTNADNAPAGLKAVAEIVASELTAQPGLRVITSADIDTVLGKAAMDQQLGCDTEAAACLAEIGGALGVAYIVGGQVDQLGGTWLLSMAVIDSANGQAAHRVTKRVSSLGAVPDAAAEGARELAVVILPESAQLVRADMRTGSEGRRKTARLATVVGGSLVAASGGVLMATALSTHSAAQNVEAGEDPITWEKARAANLRWGAGLGLVAGGAAAVASAFVFLREPRQKVAVSATPIPGGAMAVVRVSSW